MMLVFGAVGVPNMLLVTNLEQMSSLNYVGEVISIGAFLFWLLAGSL